MNELDKFQRGAEEANELFQRFWSAFPVRRNEGTLKQRHNAGDRNVVCIVDEDGSRSYALRLTKEQKQALVEAYAMARPGYEKSLDGGFEATVFASIVESWGDSIQLFSERKPDVHKNRTRPFESVEVALLKLEEALSKMDSGALGYWYAHIVDATAKAGHQLSASDGSLVSMVNAPVRAVVEAGELRQTLRPLITAWVEATKESARSLPKHDHHQHDDRFQTAKALERLAIEHQIPFDASETGFPALCLRAAFDLGGLEVEKVSYWLKKAADDPDSFACFKERMTQKSDGENLPAD